MPGIMPEVSPNRVIGAAIALFVFYWILAMFLPAMALRDTVNALAFGTQVMVVVTWFSAAKRSVRNSASDGAWLLVLAVFFISFVAMSQRIYTIAFNYMGRPESWAESPISGFWPYSYMIAGAMFLISPGVKNDGVRPGVWWSLLSAGVLGGFVAGVVFTLSVPTF